MTVVSIGVDFGTTNSVVAFAHKDGRVESRIWSSLEGPTATFRTALTFWREGQSVRHVAGPDAIARAAKPVGDQRFVQSLKTHLASRAFSETRLFGKRFTIEELVATFLRDLLGSDLPTCAVVAGRPVVFAGAAADEALALRRLSAAYAAAEVGAVEFAFEPMGAAYWYARHLIRDETVLVADFGGGTSDFSILRFSKPHKGRLSAQPLAHAGVGIAGDSFDARIIEHAVAPQLGKGATYRSLGKVLPVPAYVHAAFSQWHQLSWLKSGTILSDLLKLAAASDRGDELDALVTIVEMDMGFALHRAVSGLKAELSVRDRASLRFEGWGVSIQADVSRDAFEAWIAPDVTRIGETIDSVLAEAGTAASAVDAVFLTGGTSFVPAVRRLFEHRFAPERIHEGDAFQSVASGLAAMAADRLGT